VATPFRVTFAFGGINIPVETNCEQLAQAFAPLPQNESKGEPALRLIAIVDSELQLEPSAAPLAIETGDVVWGRGEGSLFALDRECRELTIFLRRFDAQSFEAFLREMLGRLQFPPSDER
jgi:hypothetical protein